MADPDYGKWIQDALDRNPRLTKADLSRHLGHGADRARLIKIMDGSRKVTGQEILAIAEYLGVPPPGFERFLYTLPISGIIDHGIWFEDAATRAGSHARVPARPDHRFPANNQVAFEVGAALPQASLAKGDYVIGTLAYKPTSVADGTMFVCARQRDSLMQIALASATIDNRGMHFSIIGGAANTDILTPKAMVIGMFRPIG